MKEKSLEDIISKTCEEITLTTLHPRSAMQVVFQIMQDSGSVSSQKCMFQFQFKTMNLPFQEEILQ